MNVFYNEYNYFNEDLKIKTKFVPTMLSRYI